MYRRLTTRLFVPLWLLAGLAAFTPLGAQAPATGRIVGRIIDLNTGLGLSDVGIQVVGTTMGTMSGIDGRYSLSRVPAGTVTLHVRRLGYQAKTVTGLLLDPRTTAQQDIGLQAATVQLQTLEVTAEAERGSVNSAIDAQRNATGIVSAVSAEQIAKSPDGDAAAAVQRVSGVTVQDGKYVAVRGLGERYTTTSLNGSRLPSPEPERKVVPLDLFPSGLLQAITTSKTFTPNQPGDFSGASVDIRTREFPAERQLSYSLSMGYNDRVTGKDVVAAPAEPRDWLGFGAGSRSLPAVVAGAGHLTDNPTQGQYNAIVGAFRNVWSTERQPGAPNVSMGLSAGGNDPLLGRRVGYVGSLTYSRSQEARANELRAFAIPDGTGGEQATEEFRGSTGRTSVLWGGLLNLSTLVGTSSRLMLNNTFTRSADNEARDEQGIDEDDAREIRVQRLEYVERFMRSTQLAGEHQIGERHRFDWSLTAAGVTRDEPDRSELIYAFDTDGAAFLLNVPEAALRTFSKVTEDSYGASGDYAIRFGDIGREHTLKIGALGRYTMRDAVQTPYDIRAASLPLDERKQAAEAIFDGRYAGAADSIFSVNVLFQGGAYEAEDVLGAAYGMMEYQLSDRMRLIGGARVEFSHLRLDAAPTFGTPIRATPSYTDVLPAVALNLTLTDNQALRLSASQTLARPEYREVAPIEYRTRNGEVVRGNAALRRTLIRNADVRWEWYPNPGEALSVAAFAKQFDDPIERIYRLTSGTRGTTFENADGAVNYGLELEARKGLGFLTHRLVGVSIFSNLTLMESDIDLAGVTTSSSASRAMVGQAPFVVNGGITYASESGRLSGTVLYNVVGRRIYAASLPPLPDVYEEARHALDVSLRMPVTASLQVKLDARNLLDAPYEITQGTVQREFYEAGRVFSAGLSWQP
ncbi:MAG TPA: TonB-dependent receptor [Gemmatimonadaceae bacterium]|nr:TonB-dependent receptor [Gemmatimonadaceae bacterium]